MAALNRPSTATYEIHENVVVDTTDNEDHTFCGIMFPIKAKEIVPLEKVVIRSVSVRGQLGKISIWITGENETPDANATYGFRLSPRFWIKIYESEHKPSLREYALMKLDTPVVIRPGEIRAIYIHSELPGDESIVYDNTRSNGTENGRPQQNPRYDDAMITILSGKAHLSNVPFGQTPIWGWGNAWRDHREFVGRLEYGAIYKLWQPDLNVKYGDKFRRAACRLAACQRRQGSSLATLPDECIYYIINMCRWDWFGDTSNDMKDRRRILKERRRIAELQRRQEQKRLRLDRKASLETSKAATVAVKPKREQLPYSSGCRQCNERAASAGNDKEIDENGLQLDCHQLDSNAIPPAFVMEGLSSIDSDSDDDVDDKGKGSLIYASGVIMEGLLNDDYDDIAYEENDEEVNEQMSEEENEDDEDETTWERYNGYHADGNIFSIRDYSSDEEDRLDEDDPGNRRENWVLNNLTSFFALRALAGDEL